MTTPETSRPATVATGHLVLTEELREQIHERLLGMLDSTTRRLARDHESEGEDGFDTTELVDELEAIRAALVKLEAGYYGVCEMCEGPIPFERLDAIPSVRCCVTCQARPRRLLG